MTPDALSQHSEPVRNRLGLAVGDVIRYSAGGSIYTGTITKLGRHNHVRVNNSPLVIPPNWIIRP